MVHHYWCTASSRKQDEVGLWICTYLYIFSYVNTHLRKWAAAWYKHRCACGYYCRRVPRLRACLKLFLCGISARWVRQPGRPLNSFQVPSSRVQSPSFTTVSIDKLWSFFKHTKTVKFILILYCLWSSFQRQNYAKYWALNHLFLPK